VVIQRGDIWWASLDAPNGSSPGFTHPLVIIQADDFNTSRINTIIGLVITSNVHLAEAPGNVFLEKTISKLPHDSVINVSQIVTIDKSYLREKVSRLPKAVLSEVSEGVKLVLAL
jgi:mRNA interferase MazF